MSGEKWLVEIVGDQALIEVSFFTFNASIHSNSADRFTFAHCFVKYIWSIKSAFQISIEEFCPTIFNPNYLCCTPVFL